MVFEEEFRKIRFAFDKVKREMFFLIEKVNRIDSQNKIELNELKKEIEILKLKLVTVDTPKQNIICEDGHFLVGNSQSKKVHYSNCPYAHKMSKEHTITFNNIKEALDEGYDRCSCLSD